MDEVLPSAAVIERIGAVFPLRPLLPSAPGETASRWAYVDGGADGAGEIGVISSVTQAFCGDCNRARLSTEGKLYLCLFAHQGHDLRALLRDPAGLDDLALAAAIGGVWQQRSDRYSELRGSAAGVQAAAAKVEMSYIGG
jgi:cyclic pyranopterin phosphate synthase